MTTTSTLETSILAAIVAEPDDTLHRLAMADLCEEQGRDGEAECWRWMAEKGVRPQYYLSRCYMNQKSREGEFKWWWVSDAHKGLEQNFLPTCWLNGIVDDEADDGRGNKWFITAESAYLAAVAAWLKLTPEEREECWRWNP